MARRNVIPTPMMEYERKTPKGEFLGWGKKAIRKVTTRATSPRLLKYRRCVAAEMGAQEFDDLKGVQEAFRTAAAKCGKEAASEETTGKLPKGFKHKY